MNTSSAAKKLDTDLLTQVIGVDPAQVDLGQYALRAITGATAEDEAKGNTTDKLDKILETATDDLLTQIASSFFAA